VLLGASDDDTVITGKITGTTMRVLKNKLTLLQPPFELTNPNWKKNIRNWLQLSLS